MKRRENGGRRLASPFTIESAASRSETPAWSSPQHLRIVPRHLRRAVTRSSASNKSLRSGSTSTSRVAKSGSKGRPPIRWTRTRGGWHSRYARNDSPLRPAAGDGGRRRSPPRPPPGRKRTRRVGFARRRVSGNGRLLESGVVRRQRRLRADEYRAE